MMPAQHRMVGFKVPRTFTRLVGKHVQPLQSVKLFMQQEDIRACNKKNKHKGHKDLLPEFNLTY
jgi:hypothetical protein